ncbi:hypothetical protein T4C_3702 [Trichinella pseudospiralis]|uniref:Uncharacterized protein n=1 Tax=Trichinella pseudospiralis TaxID=6337 RepID=A0A0V1HFH3_TRIPS|nr:hypothetical protein T4C_3702 [Trichinella pseudospiralis]
MAPVVSMHDCSNSAELTTPYSTNPLHRCNQKAATRLRRCTHKIWEKTAPNMTKHFYCFKKAMAPCMTKMGVAATKRKYKKSVL